MNNVLGRVRSLDSRLPRLLTVNVEGIVERTPVVLELANRERTKLRLASGNIALELLVNCVCWIK